MRKLLLLLWLTCPLVAADTTIIYRHVGADGVVTFSDEVRPGATVIEVETTSPRAEDVERAADLYEQQLELIGVLEADRRAQEQAAADRRADELELARMSAARTVEEAAAPSEARYVYAPLYGERYGERYSEGYGWGYPHRPYPPHGGRPDHGKPPPTSAPKNSRPLGTGSH